MALTYNLVMEQGSTFNTVVTYADSSGVASDLTSYEVSCQMRRSYYSANSTSITSVITAPEDGEITLSLTPAQTANVRPGRYVYDINISTAGTVTRILEGIVTVTPGVTK